jgi:uncharacterized protein
MVAMTTVMSVLRGMYAAEAEYLAGASFTLLAPFFAEDVVLHQADALPYGGTWHGHDGLEQFFRTMSGTWDEFEMLDQKFLNDTSPLVVLTHVRARARATGRTLTFPILQTITVEDGRIVEVHPFYWDTAAVADACSPA